ncbi:MAG: zf-HC2 domain-containing protein, partial [Planctomycetota bacterium]
MDELLNPVDATCAKIRQLMLAEADRELSTAEAGRIEEHVAACSACQGVLAGEDGMAALDLLLRKAPVEYPGEAAWAALGERLQER